MVDNDSSVVTDPWTVAEPVWGLRLPEIRFGRDSVSGLGRQLHSLGVDRGARGLLVTDGTLADAGHVDRVHEHVRREQFSLDVYEDSQREPHANDVDDCVEFARDARNYDFYVALGGGSVLDTAKITRTVVAGGGSTVDYVSSTAGSDERPVRADAPLVVLPTTSGSPAQLTPHSIVRTGDGGEKAVVRGDALSPDAVVLDPTFSLTLPPGLTAETAMDVLGGVLESYTAPRLGPRPRSPGRPVGAVRRGRTRLTDLFAERAIRLLADNLRTAVHDGTDLDARADLMLGALFAAVASLTTGAHLGHAVAYAIQAKFHTAHGVTVGTVTPAATLDHNVSSDPARFGRIAELLGGDATRLSPRESARQAKVELVHIQRDLAVLPSGLEELVGLDEDLIDELAAWTMETQGRLLENNPVIVTEGGLRDVFRDAVHNWS